MKRIIAAVLLWLATVPAYGQSVQQSGNVTPNHPSCWVTTGVIKDCGTIGPSQIVNGIFSIGLDTVGHERTTGSPPTLSSCGTSPAISGTDVAGEVTMGTAAPTGCTITFANPYTNAPWCVVTWQTNIATMQYTISTSAISLSQTATSSNKVNYRCTAQTGG